MYIKKKSLKETTVINRSYTSLRHNKRYLNRSYSELNTFSDYNINYSIYQGLTFAQSVAIGGRHIE